jgi:HPt (histidine-containing phosphotransfer) domain-containing protein
MTANAMRGDRERCLEAGMDDYVTKPVRLEELVSALERLPMAPIAQHKEAGHHRLIDYTVLDNMQAQLGGGDATIVVEFIDMFLHETPALVAEIVNATAQTEAALIERAAHTLKSNAGIVGANTLMERCRQLEELAHQREIQQLPATAADLNTVYELSMQALQQARDRYAALIVG